MANNVTQSNYAVLTLVTQILSAVGILAAIGVLFFIVKIAISMAIGG